MGKTVENEMELGAMTGFIEGVGLEGQWGLVMRGKNWESWDHHSITYRLLGVISYTS